MNTNQSINKPWHLRALTLSLSAVPFFSFLSLSTSAHAMPPQSIQGEFKKCLSCHPQYADTNGQLDWNRVLQNGAEILRRLETSPTPSNPMPPSFATFQIDDQTKDRMRAAILAELDPEDSGLPLDRLSLPAGFKLSLFARVPGARSMTLAPDGIFVGTGGFSNPDPAGRVFHVKDEGLGAPRNVETVISGLNNPNGVTYHSGTLYIAETHRIIALPEVDTPNPLGGAHVVTNQFPAQQSHSWKYLRMGPDGKLYVPVGAPGNAVNVDCRSSQFGAPFRFAAIFRLNPDGSGFESYAFGVRNTVGFDWHPETGNLWFTDNGRDQIGGNNQTITNNSPPDELNEVTAKDLHFGYPYVHGRQEIHDPTHFGQDCHDRSYTRAKVDLGPHVAALGMRFYTGQQFPASFQNQIFIAEHGSWNRQPKIGYRVSIVTESNGSYTYEPFLDGFLNDDTQVAFGRPVDVLVYHDGSLLVSDDKAGAVYRISYVGE